MPFDIEVHRYFDGRFIASVPGIHEHCATIAGTREEAVRRAQIEALRLMADYITSNRKMPDEMRAWFTVTAETGTVTHVGGIRCGEIADEHLMTAGSKLIPQRADIIPKKTLPKHGTTQHTAMVNELLAAKEAAQKKLLPGS